MRVKLIGYSEMKKKKGKVLFVVQDRAEGVTGQSCDRVFLWEELSDKIKPESVGKDIDVVYGMGYSGKAYVADITVK